MAEKNWKSIVPVKFYHRGLHTKVRTVGELIALLQELPPELPFCSERGAKAQIIVYDISEPDDAFAAIREVED